MSNVNIFSDYWKAYPNHKLFSEFSGQKSDTMWILFLMFNPTKDNPLVSMLDIELRKSEIEKNFIKKKVNWEHILSLKEAYKSNILLTRAKKELLFYYDLLEERRKYIESLSYATDSEAKEKLVKSTRSIWEEFDKIKEMVDKEDAANSHIQGGRKESASEQKLI